MTVIPLCQHIKIDGLQCQSPSLRHRSYCYHHDRRHNLRPRKATARRPHQYEIQLDALEDPASIQLALSVVVAAVASGDLSSDRASVILYGLQIASSNLRNLMLSYGASLQE